jgi:hypothetical protein
MEATSEEIKQSQLFCIIDELAGLTFTKGDWNGYHMSAYCKNFGRKTTNRLAQQVCEQLQDVDVTKYSLELQTWWRDHQEADKKRLEKEISDSDLEIEKLKALDKLTPYEKKLLGLK